MAEPKRYAALPGYDTAPDVYETPSLASDTSTVQTSPRSASPSPSNTSESEAESYGVSKRRLYPERARSKFSPNRIDGRNVDLGDRVGGSRKGYRTRRRRSEDEESLETRLARLRREVEECKTEAEKVGDHEGEEGVGEEVDALGKLLAGIEAPTKMTRAPRARPATNGTTTTTSVSAQNHERDPEPEQTLAQVADFDTRLSLLERSLGINSLDAASSDTVASPVLPTLALLDQQLSALRTASSLSGLDAARSRIAQLAAEAQKLRGKQTQPNAAVNGDAPENAGAQAALSPEDLTNLNSLYTLLPTLSSLAPTVPALLTRLRSLRTLHAGAATAASELDDLEKRQEEMDKELSMWREGLENVEEAVAGAAEANGRNAKFVKEWVDELEEKMRGLGR